MVNEIVVLGFPKCGTSALIRYLEDDLEVDLLRPPGNGLEVAWPGIKELALKPKPGRIIAHKFTAYIYDQTALAYLAEVNPKSHMVVCIRDPRKSLVSWWNMHKRIAQSGSAKDHFAWKERDFYANCTIEDYYEKYAIGRLDYAKYLLDLTKLVSKDRIFVVSQESLAWNMDNIVQTIKDASRGNFHPVPNKQENEETYKGYADKTHIELSEKIVSELALIHDRVLRVIESQGIRNSL